MRHAKIDIYNDNLIHVSDKDSIIVILNGTPICIFPSTTHFSQIVSWVKDRLNQQVDYTYGFRIYSFDVKRIDNTTKVIQYSRKPMDLMSRDSIENVVIISRIENTDFTTSEN